MEVADVKLERAGLLRWTEPDRAADGAHSESIALGARRLNDKRRVSQLLAV